MLAETTIEWRSLTLYGTDGPGRMTFRTLAGWEETPPGERRRWRRPGAHGVIGGRAWAEGRTVVVTGRVFSPTERDLAVRALEQAAPYGVEDTLSVTHAGRTLSAQATLVRRTLPRGVWGAGFFEWTLEWEVDDPLRYGDVISDTTGLPFDTGGLRYPLYTDGDGDDVGFLDYGEFGDEGTVTLENEGSAETWPRFTVTGPLPSGFMLTESGTGRSLMFTGAVPAGSSLFLDSATGEVTLDGTASRASQLIRSEWTPIPPGGSVTYGFYATSPGSPTV